MEFPLTIVTASADETRDFARNFAKELRVADVIFLIGDLGAGKTTFTSGLGVGLEIKEQIISPTFTLARSYLSGSTPLTHIDAYRLVTASGEMRASAIVAELENAILDDISDSITVIEWGETFASEYIHAHNVNRAFWVSLEMGAQIDFRQITITEVVS